MRKIQNRKWEIENDNFDYYVQEVLSGMTDAQKSKLPDDLSFKIGKGIKYATTNLTFVQKLYVLSTVFNKKVSVVIEDEKGISATSFKKILQAQHGKIGNKEVVDEFRHHGAFFLGDRDLMSWFEYANMICATPVYKLASDYRAELRNKSKVRMRADKISEAFSGILKVIRYYEANKKRMVDNYGIIGPEWFALSFFYEKEATATEFKKHFQYAYRSNERDLSQAITSLKRKGLLDSRAVSGKNNFKHYITPRGKEYVMRIMQKVVFGE